MAVKSTITATKINENSNTSPFFQGQEKIVRLRLTKKGIEVFNFEKNEDLPQDPSGINDTPVMTLPGKFVEFSCKKDQKNECTPFYRVKFGIF